MTAPTLSIENEILHRFVSNKACISAPAEHPLMMWKDFANCLIYELPIMYKNKENWIYIHYAETLRQGNAIVSCGTTSQLQAEFKNLEAQGLTECPSDNENKENFWFAWEHPQFKSRVIVATLTFKRFLGEEDDEGNCKGAGLCPLLWGLGILADGLTYIHADFKIVKKEDMKAIGAVPMRGQRCKGLVR